VATFPTLQAQIGGGKLHVDKAFYGKDGKGFDCTRRVQAMARNGSLDFKVTNDILGGDPNKGADKFLKLSYTYMGHREIKSFKEGERVRLP